MATGPQRSPTGNLPAPVPAHQSVPAFGGNPTGRTTKFKFPAGTPQGDEERRDAERKRKAAARSVAAKMVEPPPLPSAGPEGPDSLPPSANGVGSCPAGPVAPADAPVPWDPEQLKPLFDELIDGAEEGRVEKFRSLATEAGFPANVVKEISSDAKYAPALKRSMQITAPRVTAKAANRVGLSGKYSDEGILLTALVANWVQGRRLAARLEKLIAEQKAAKAAEQKKEVTL